VNQDTDQWSVAGTIGGVRISGLSDTPDSIVAELYPTGDKLHRPIGSVSLRYSDGPGGGWHGLEDLLLLITSHNKAQEVIDNS
ncbi:MAG: hypothetical protein ABIQ64_00495, partial [Candidatus Saccharimonadales bacterium]